MIFRLAHKNDDTAIGVLKVDPLKSICGEIKLPECRILAVDMVEIAHKRLQIAMIVVLQQMPVEAVFFIPLPPLSEFAPMNSSFCPDVRT